MNVLATCLQKLIEHIILQNLRSVNNILQKINHFFTHAMELYYQRQGAEMWATARYDSVLHHKIYYDDKVTMWHDLSQESWKYDSDKPCASSQVATLAAEVHHKALAKLRRQEAASVRRNLAEERHREMMMGMVWGCEFGTVY